MSLLNTFALFIKHCYKRGYAAVNVAMISVPPMDQRGYFSYGLTNFCMEEMLDAADHIILEVNEHMPIIYGMEGDHIHISVVAADGTVT